MNYRDVTSRKAMLAAINECDRLGPALFREVYGFGEATTYVLRHEGREYDSKALVGVAHKYQHPLLGPLKSDTFSGGKGAAAGRAMRLGFQVDGVVRDPEDWTLAECTFAVEAYFQRFKIELQTGETFRTALEEVLTELPGRKRSALEQKFANISAILEKRLGLRAAKGFGVRDNTQILLSAIVYDWLEDHPDFFDQEPNISLLPGAEEVAPPTSAEVEEVERERRAMRVNYAERDERNRVRGRRGEQIALGVLKRELAEANRADLAARVEWVSETQGDGLGYDIASYTPDGKPLFVEVKTTSCGVKAPFLISQSEVRFSAGHPEQFVLFRVFDLDAVPRYYRLFGAVEVTCALRTQTYIATPRNAQKQDAIAAG